MAQAPSGFPVRPVARAPQPPGVALELLDDRQQVVRDRRRLRALRVRVDGEDGFAVSIGQVEEARAQIKRSGGELENELALPHPVHRHVDVVAAARRVEPAGGIFAARFDNQALDVEEEVLAGAVVSCGTQFREGDGVERDAQHVRIFRRNDPLRGEHHQVRVVNRHQRPGERALGVLEVLVQDIGDVLGGKPHDRSIARTGEPEITSPPRRTLRTRRSYPVSKAI